MNGVDDNLIAALNEIPVGVNVETKSPPFNLF
jgi:hypothetical protein